MVFLSHAHVDEDVAQAVDTSVTDAFRGLLTVFRSSDSKGSIEIGDSIKQKIKGSLDQCIAALTLLSHSSINRPWVNIEFGALWMLDTPIIPMCFPDLKVNQLPFHFADTKVCNLGRQDDCIALFDRLHGFVQRAFPFELKKQDITRYGKSLHKKVRDAINARVGTCDEAPLPDLTTVWIIGSYSELKDHELSVANANGGTSLNS